MPEREGLEARMHKVATRCRPARRAAVAGRAPGPSSSTVDLRRISARDRLDSRWSPRFERLLGRAPATGSGLRHSARSGKSSWPAWKCACVPRSRAGERQPKSWPPRVFKSDSGDPATPGLPGGARCHAGRGQDARLSAHRGDAGRGARPAHAFRESCDGPRRICASGCKKEIDARDQRPAPPGRTNRQGHGSLCAKDYPVRDARAGRAPGCCERIRRDVGAVLEQDDLPRFEGQQFKELLNENAIREVANFQSQLHRERQNHPRAHRGHQPIPARPSTTNPESLYRAGDRGCAGRRRFAIFNRICARAPRERLPVPRIPRSSESKFLQVKRLIGALSRSRRLH